MSEEDKGVQKGRSEKLWVDSRGREGPEVVIKTKQRPGWGWRQQG